MTIQNNLRGPRRPETRETRRMPALRNRDRRPRRIFVALLVGAMAAVIAAAVAVVIAAGALTFFPLT